MRRGGHFGLIERGGWMVLWHFKATRGWLWRAHAWKCQDIETRMNYARIQFLSWQTPPLRSMSTPLPRSHFVTNPSESGQLMLLASWLAPFLKESSDTNRPFRRHNARGEVLNQKRNGGRGRIFPPRTGPQINPSSLPYSSGGGNFN